MRMFFSLFDQWLIHPPHLRELRDAQICFGRGPEAVGRAWHRARDLGVSHPVTCGGREGKRKHPKVHRRPAA